VDYLLAQQQDDGSWANHPAMTGLACMALKDCDYKDQKKLNTAIEKGREFMLKFVQPDGSINLAQNKRGPGIPIYVTSICLSTLAIIDNPKDKKVMRSARNYLLNNQKNENFVVDGKSQPVSKDNYQYGGFGYSGKTRPDLSNTQWAMEALALTEKLDDETNGGTPEDRKKSEIAWKSALQFVSSVQNLPSKNKATWVKANPDKENEGAFIYCEDSFKYKDKKQNLKSLPTYYGSLTYAGVKSLIYAKLNKNDERFKAAWDWITRNYNLDANPRMGADGYYYYMVTFAKTMQIADRDFIETKDGKKHYWRKEFQDKAVELQQDDGSWVNDKSGRWWESQPVLVSSYMVLSLKLALSPYDGSNKKEKTVNN
jgi:squalene-hopene/tetraprenyl-beta-curcumene cyclase